MTQTFDSEGFFTFLVALAHSAPHFVAAALLAFDGYILFIEYRSGRISELYLGQIGNIIIHLGFAYYWAGMEKSDF